MRQEPSAKNIKPMKLQLANGALLIGSCIACALLPGLAAAQDSPAPGITSLEQVKAAGARRSSFSNQQRDSVGTENTQPKLEVFRKEIAPILKEAAFHSVSRKSRWRKEPAWASESACCWPRFC